VSLTDEVAQKVKKISMTREVINEKEQIDHFNSVIQAVTASSERYLLTETVEFSVTFGKQ